MLLQCFRKRMSGVYPMHEEEMPKCQCSQTCYYFVCRNSQVWEEYYNIFRIWHGGIWASELRPNILSLYRVVHLVEDKLLLTLKLRTLNWTERNSEKYGMMGGLVWNPVTAVPLVPAAELLIGQCGPSSWHFDRSQAQENNNNIQNFLQLSITCCESKVC